MVRNKYFFWRIFFVLFYFIHKKNINKKLNYAMNEQLQKISEHIKSRLDFFFFYILQCLAFAKVPYFFQNFIYTVISDHQCVFAK